MPGATPDGKALSACPLLVNEDMVTKESSQERKHKFSLLKYDSLENRNLCKNMDMGRHRKHL